MPIYEYECGACGHQLEVIQKITESPLSECPVCHQPKLNKLISATSFQLKGTGWYATDFREKGKAPTSTENKADQSGSDNKNTTSDTSNTNSKTSSGAKDEKKKTPPSSSSTERAAG